MESLSGVLDLTGAGQAMPATARDTAPRESRTRGADGPDGTGYMAQRDQVVPRQLPAATRHFTGRALEVAVLDSLADGTDGAQGTVVISAIGGTAGVGKTALAVYWGHRAADRFPDGQLYTNLRGFDPSGVPLAPASALRGLLAALHVPPDEIPAGLDAQAGLYRSLMAGKRMLIVLDNARDAAQVRPLLPGGADCFVIVTSRSQLVGLAAAEGAHLVCLDVLTEAEARELLSRRLGPERVQGESRAAGELIRLCARLPLALAVAATRAAAGPCRSLDGLVEELRHAEGRLDSLDASDPATSVRAVLSWSYQILTDPAARMFRLLGVHAGPDISAPAAASLAGTSLELARAALRELVTANLLAEHVQGRLSCHDLLRDFAARLAQETDGDAGCRAATGRLLDHFRQAAWAAERVLHPTRSAVALPPPGPGVIREEFAGYGGALSWFQAEHQTLLAAIACAAEDGFDTHAWQIACGLRTYLDRQGYWQDWVAVQQTGLRAARRAGSLAGQAHAHRDLALAYVNLGCYPDAHAHQRQALDLYRKMGDDAAQGHVHLDAARSFEGQGQITAALAESEQALDLYRRTGHRQGEPNALNAVGWYHARLGSPLQALAYCQQSIDALRQAGQPARRGQRLGHPGVRPSLPRPFSGRDRLLSERAGHVRRSAAPLPAGRHADQPGGHPRGSPRPAGGLPGLAGIPGYPR